MDCSSTKFSGIGYSIYRRLGTDCLKELGLKEAKNRQYRNMAEVGYPIAKGFAKVLGISDLLVLREKTIRYEPSDIAHIENVLSGEMKKRTHRRSRKTEESFLSIRESEEETSRDLETTERFSIEKETSELIKKESGLEAGVTISASYGGVITLEAGVSGYIKNSKEKSKQIAKSFSREKTERASSRIKEKMKEERFKKTIEEFEEINEHGLDNTENLEHHVVGVYRWVDKIHKATVYNYGQRLCVEFMVTRPAAFYIHSLMYGNATEINAVDPGEFTLSLEDLDESNYSYWSDMYQASNIEPFPPFFKSIAKTLKFDMATSKDYRKEVQELKTEDLSIPDGYETTEAFVAATFTYLKYNKGAYPTSRYYIALGGRNVVIHGNDTSPFSMLTTRALEPVRGNFALSARCFHYIPVGISIEIQCERTELAANKWRQDTYEKLRDAYFNMKSKYEEQLAAASIGSGVNITGQSPLENRRIEQTEIKKLSISILTGQIYDSFAGIFEGRANEYPEINFRRAREEKDYVKFFEQAFEWSNMTYVFYPYFWAKKYNKWLDLSTIQNNDSAHAAFLRSSYARVVVPVRRGFECALMRYYETGEKVWKNIPFENGIFDPEIDLDDCESGSFYNLGIIEEKLEQSGADYENEKQYVESYEITLPTSLVILQQTPHLPNRDNNTWGIIK